MQFRRLPPVSTASALGFVLVLSLGHHNIRLYVHKLVHRAIDSLLAWSGHGRCRTKIPSRALWSAWAGNHRRPTSQFQALRVTPEDLRGVMPLDLNYPGLICIHKDPLIFAIPDFLPADVCDEIIRRARSDLRRCDDWPIVSRRHTRAAQLHQLDFLA